MEKSDCGVGVVSPERKKIWLKSEGKCWYCGTDLGDRWHIDHMNPVFRADGQMWKPKNDTFDNKVPACVPCNLFKSVFTVEQFRYEISRQVARARRDSVNFRTAERFGLIRETNTEIKFWFELNHGEVKSKICPK